MDAYAQAYHWDLDRISQLTYPQIVMLNHAADYNRKLMDARIAERRAEGSASPSESIDMPMIGGKRLDEMTSDEIAGYMNSDEISRESGSRPRVIKTKKKE